MTLLSNSEAGRAILSAEFVLSPMGMAGLADPPSRPRRNSIWGDRFLASVRPPAAETSRVGGLCFDQPNPLHVGSIYRSP